MSYYYNDNGKYVKPNLPVLALEEKIRVLRKALAGTLPKNDPGNPVSNEVLPFVGNAGEFLNYIFLNLKDKPGYSFRKTSMILGIEENKIISRIKKRPKPKPFKLNKTPSKTYFNKDINIYSKEECLDLYAKNGGRFKEKFSVEEATAFILAFSYFENIINPDKVFSEDNVHNAYIEAFSHMDSNYQRKFPGMIIGFLKRNNEFDYIHQEMINEYFEKTNQEKEFEVRFMADSLKLAFSTLTERDIKILVLKYGLCDETPRTYEEVGEKLKITREKARQLEVRALKKLRMPERKVMLEY